MKTAGFAVVEGDVNGDGKADFQTQVDGFGKPGAGPRDNKKERVMPEHFKYSTLT